MSNLGTFQSGHVSFIRTFPERAPAGFKLAREPKAIEPSAAPFSVKAE